jgi:tetratricopeptide (TPR) repeat protein
VEAGLKAYRSALEMALATEPMEAETPRFNEERGVSRYCLPLEALLDPIIGELQAWSPAEAGKWVEALPEHGLVELVLARRLRQAGSYEARGCLKKLAELAVDESQPGGRVALELAAKGEALALLEEWAAAAAAYRAAIKRAEPGIICRTWLFNLAEVEARAGRFEEAHKIWDAARVAELQDEVNQRLVMARTRYGQTGTRVKRASVAEARRDTQVQRASVRDEAGGGGSIPDFEPIGDAGGSGVASPAGGVLSRP